MMLNVFNYSTFASSNFKISKFISFIFAQLFTTQIISLLSISGTATIIRADPGTENVKVEVLQTLFRASGRDSFAGDKEFYVWQIYSKSGETKNVFTGNTMCMPDTY